jgi:hypothetical protein
MLFAYPRKGGALHWMATIVHRPHFSHDANDLAVIFAALFIMPLLWVLLAHPIHPVFVSVTGPDQCVYLGRAGSHCPAAGRDAQNDREDCVSLGRAGHYCPAPASAGR